MASEVKASGAGSGQTTTPDWVSGAGSKHTIDEGKKDFVSDIG